MYHDIIMIMLYNSLFGNSGKCSFFYMKFMTVIVCDF